MLIQNVLMIFLFVVIATKYIVQKKKLCADKKYFADVLNHNLRICSLAQNQGMELLIKEGAKTNLQEELFSTISNSCKYNLDLVTTLLDTYKFDNKEQNIQAEMFDINCIDWFFDDEVVNMLKEKNIIIIKELKNCQLYADKNFIQKLINNLLYIALVYSYKNTETVINLSSKGKNLEIQITYCGNTLSKISANHDYMAVGCGIKMYFCKKIIDFYKGKMKLLSLKNNKISILLSLPVLCKVQKFNKNLSLCKLF